MGGVEKCQGHEVQSKKKKKIAKIFVFLPPFIFINVAPAADGKKPAHSSLAT